MPDAKHDTLRPHSHSNNTTPPDDNTDISLLLPAGEVKTLTLEALQQYPATHFAYSYVTDHGTHGPYQLTGVRLLDLLDGVSWAQLEVISADGFGNRILREELGADNLVMLYYASNGELLSRQNGLVRLVVPSETDNALRQIKWVREVRAK